VPRVVVILGHSIGQGVGDLASPWAGFGIQPGATVVTGGTTLTAYQANAGVGPDAGIMPYIVGLIQAAGEPRPILVRRAVSGAIVSQVQSSQMLNAQLDLQALGCGDPDWVIALIGENDAQDVTESAAYTTRLPAVVDTMEHMWPNARITLHDPPTTHTGGYPEHPTITAVNRATCALRGTRAMASDTGIALQDTVHPSSAGYATLAANLWAAYRGLP
jgi:lysophospholipase L1-like esterase